MSNEKAREFLKSFWKTLKSSLEFVAGMGFWGISLGCLIRTMISLFQHKIVLAAVFFFLGVPLFFSLGHLLLTPTIKKIENF